MPRDYFPPALKFVLKWEGGYVNDPDDPGGATNFGLSLRFLQGLPLKLTDSNGDGALTWEDVKAMPQSRVSGIYSAYFWLPMFLAYIPGRLAVAMFDSAVNLGRSRAGRFLQQAYNARQDILGRGQPIEEDGKVGPLTVRRVTGLCTTPGIEAALTQAVLDRRVAHYESLCCERPEMQKYHKGWMARVEDLRKTVATI